jgi:alpha-glucosidase
VSSGGARVDLGRCMLDVSLWADDVVRIQYAVPGMRPPRRSWSVIEASPDTPAALSVDSDANGTELTGDRVVVAVDSQGRVEIRDRAEDRVVVSDRPSGGPKLGDEHMIWTHTMPEGERYYGMGERTGMLDKRGYRYTCWTTDRFEEHGPRTDEMYVAVPFVFGLDARGCAWGVFVDTTHRSVFDFADVLGGTWSVEVDAPWVDWYCMIGPDCETVLDRFTALTGRPMLPPRWALGHHQTRWGYECEDDIRTVAREFRARRLPLDVVGLDIDAMDDHRVFTWDRRAFPDPARLTQDLAADGIHVSAIVDSGVKHEPRGGYSTFDDGMARNAFLCEPGSDEVLLRHVWPGLCAFPDFLDPTVAQWWGDEHRSLTDLGVRGFVQDMNEPAMRDRPIDEPGARRVEPPSGTEHGRPGERVTHVEAHNVYGTLQVRAAAEGARRLLPDERVLVLSRAGYTGVQRWSGIWTGDNASTWEHLALSLPQLCTLGLCGIPFVGADIGGFFGNCTPELLVRWMQLGACYPLARNNSARDGARQEPWVHGPEVEDACRRALEWRYALLPYLYTQLEHATRTGVPVLRPLFFVDPHDDRCRSIVDEALLGPDLLIAPVMLPGMRERAVYLPRGDWYDMRTDERFCGPSTVLVDAPLDGVIPAFARAGSALPKSPPGQWSDRTPPDRVVLDVYPDQAGRATGWLYEDDGTSYAFERGGWRRTRFEVRPDGSGGWAFDRSTLGELRAPSPRIEVRAHADRSAP